MKIGDSKVLNISIFIHYERILEQNRDFDLERISSLRRFIIYSLWLAIQLCPNRINCTLIASYLIGINGHAPSLKKQSFETMLNLVKLSSDKFNKSEMAELNDIYQKYTTGPQLPLQSSSTIFKCLNDADRLEKIGRNGYMSHQQNVFLTAEARDFAISDCHLCFYEKDLENIPIFRKYHRRLLFQNFINSFLTCMRQHTIPEWIVPTSLPISATKPIPSHIVALASFYIEKHKPGKIFSLNKQKARIDNAPNYVCNILQEFVKRGFVLHGSPRLIKGSLKPHPGTCLSGSTTGNLTGVFVTRDPLTAIFRATRKKSNLFNCWSGIETQKGSWKIFGGAEGLSKYKGHEGYVYVIPPFKNSGRLYEKILSLQECEPWFSLKVKPSDFIAPIHCIPAFEIHFICLIGKFKQKMMCLHKS